MLYEYMSCYVSFVYKSGFVDMYGQTRKSYDKVRVNEDRAILTFIMSTLAMLSA